MMEMMNHCVAITALLVIFLTLLFTGIPAERPSTCRDLRREIASREDDIRSLNLKLEEYRLARDDEKEDKLDDCNGYETCSACLLQRIIPTCGWCVLHSRCSLQENCHGNRPDTNFWITGMERCPKIKAVKPPQIPIQTAKVLEIIMPLPEYYGLYLCSFEVFGKTLWTKGRRANTTEGGVICSSPHTTTLPEIPVNTVQLPVKLSVKISNGSVLASTTDFVIYDCGRYDSCSACAASPFSCAWCVEGHRCTYNVNENCRNDIIVFSKAVSRATIREGPAHCARITLRDNTESNEILVPSGKTTRISVKIESIAQIQVVSRFHCQVKGVGRVTGRLLADTIYCDPMTVKVLDRKPISKLPFSLYWDGSREIDNIHNLHVLVYHCGLLASSCGECMDLPEKFQCGWCEGSNTCTIRNGCDEVSWANVEDMCTKPKITSFHPKSGLPTKRTNITITGINFGKDIHGRHNIRLLIKDKNVIIECDPLDYRTRLQTLYAIVCQLDTPKIIPEKDEILKGVFELKIEGKFATTSEEEYSFVDPSLTGFEPAKGVKSGGTFLKITGHGLDAGTKAEVFIGDIPCNVTSRDSSTIRCVTSPSPITRSSEVKVIFDTEEEKLPSYYFYMEDPYIGSVKSAIGVNAPVGTVSGGNIIIVDGENFDHAPDSYIYVIADGIQYPGGCTVESEKRLECYSPRFPADLLNFCGGEGYLEFDYGFRMGNVQDVQNISLTRNFEKFRVYPDPFYMPFTEKMMTKVYKSDYLTINGRYLDTAFDERDVTVHIGAEECVLTSLSHTQLVCRPPATQPKARDGNGSKLPDVVVRVQERYEFFIGFLRYSDE